MIHYSSRHEQAASLSAMVVDQLNQSIEQHGDAYCALSGGTTPFEFIKQLTESKLDWSKINLTSTDERWVSLDNERSNAGMIRRLFGNHTIRLFPLYVDEKPIEEAIKTLDDQISNTFIRIDTLILGMGNDGHTASLFPGSKQLPMALDEDNKTNVMSITAPGASEARVTLTLAKLRRARHIHLLIYGKDKLATLSKAVVLDDAMRMPICALLNDEKLTIHYAD